MRIKYTMNKCVGVTVFIPDWFYLNGPNVLTGYIFVIHGLQLRYIFSLPDSSCAIVGNGSSIRAECTEDTMNKQSGRRLLVLF